MKKLDAYYSAETQEAIGGTDPHRLIQMLMDGALERMARAKHLMLQGETASKGEQLSAAISIVGGLQESLDREQGGEIAQNLHFLYEHIQQRLLLANLKNDPEIIDQLIEVLKTIKSGWDAIREEALEIFKAQTEKAKEIANV